MVSFNVSQIVAMAIGGVVVAKSWGENYGDDTEGGSSVGESIKKVSAAQV